MRRSFAIVAIVCGSFVVPRAVQAHHSFAAEFDVDKPIKAIGIVTQVDWKNPHTWFFIDVKDETGKVTNWGFEMGSPNALMRAGWTRTAMKVGDAVTVEGVKTRDGSNRANARVVILNSTGQRLFAASSGGDIPGTPPPNQPPQPNSDKQP
jgi:Family of unknown function (DUF6152)